MITLWQQENGRLVQKDEEELDLSRHTWVDARSVTRDDIVELEHKFSIDPEHMLDILDPDELSRIEKNEVDNINKSPSKEISILLIKNGKNISNNI